MKQIIKAGRKTENEQLRSENAAIKEQNAVCGNALLEEKVK